MDGDFPWILFGVFLLWVFNILGGKKRAKVERSQRPREPRQPRTVERPPAPTPRLDPTQSEGGQLEDLLRALERQLDPAASPRPIPQPSRGPLGRPAAARLPEGEELEERESLETEPVVESLEKEVRREERPKRDWQVQAEAREKARLAQVEARDRQSHRSRHAAFDQRIREPAAPPAPAARRLTIAEIRQAFIWGEILGRPKSER